MAGKRDIHLMPTIEEAVIGCCEKLVGRSVRRKSEGGEQLSSAALRSEARVSRSKSDGL